MTFRSASLLCRSLEVQDYRLLLTPSEGTYVRVVAAYWIIVMIRLTNLNHKNKNNIRTQKKCKGGSYLGRTTAYFRWASWKSICVWTWAITPSPRTSSVNVHNFYTVYIITSYWIYCSIVGFMATRVHNGPLHDPEVQFDLLFRAFSPARRSSWWFWGLYHIHTSRFCLIEIKAISLFRDSFIANIRASLLWSWILRSFTSTG